MVRGRSNLGEILLYGGGFIIVYSILRSWGIIAQSKAQQQYLSSDRETWKPLSEQEIKSLRMNINPYEEDFFEIRTGRGRTKEFGFVG